MAALSSSVRHVEKRGCSKGNRAQLVINSSGTRQETCKARRDSKQTHASSRSCKLGGTRAPALTARCWKYSAHCSGVTVELFKKFTAEVGWMAHRVATCLGARFPSTARAAVPAPRRETPLTVSPAHQQPKDAPPPEPPPAPVMHVAPSCVPLHCEAPASQTGGYKESGTGPHRPGFCPRFLRAGEEEMGVAPSGLNARRVARSLQGGLLDVARVLDTSLALA